MLIALVALALSAADASALSVRDPDIGWPSELRGELGVRHVRATACTRAGTRSGVALQGRIGEPRTALRRAIDPYWGSDWFDPCDGGRLQIGIASGPAAALRRAVRATRRVLARRAITRYTRIVAVRSTYRELMDAQDVFETQFAALLERGLLLPGIDSSRNTIDVDVARGVSPADRDSLQRAALASPVNVVLHDIDVPDFAPSGETGAGQCPVVEKCM